MEEHAGSRRVAAACATPCPYQVGATPSLVEPLVVEPLVEEPLVVEPLVVEPLVVEARDVFHV